MHVACTTGAIAPKCRGASNGLLGKQKRWWSTLWNATHVTQLAAEASALDLHECLTQFKAQAVLQQAMYLCWAQCLCLRQALIKGHQDLLDSCTQVLRPYP